MITTLLLRICCLVTSPSVLVFSCCLASMTVIIALVGVFCSLRKLMSGCGCASPVVSINNTSGLCLVMISLSCSSSSSCLLQHTQPLLSCCTGYPYPCSSSPSSALLAVSFMSAAACTFFGIVLRSFFSVVVFPAPRYPVTSMRLVEACLCCFIFVFCKVV